MRLCGLVILTVLGWCSGDVHYGGRYEFQMTTRQTNNGLDESSYQIRSEALIERVHKELLRVKLSDLKLFTISKKLPSSLYKERKSIFDTVGNDVFFIKIKNGTIQHIFLPTSEHHHILNLKKGFSNLLQFQTNGCEIVETDVSGTCLTKYTRQGDVIRKNKLECRSQHRSFKGDIWGVSAIPHRSAEIQLVGNQLSSVTYKENFNIMLSLAKFSETGIEVEISLKLVEKPNDSETLKTMDNFNMVSEPGLPDDEYVKYSLDPDGDVREMNDEFPPKLASVLKENIKFLSNKELGKINSAVAALKVMRSVERSSYDDIYSQLKSKTNKKIIAQFLDILGAVQTPESHKAAMDFLNMNSKDHNLDFCERYLWALSTSVYHKKFIIMDLLSLTKKEINNLKLLETLVQTICSMVRKSTESSGNNEFLDQTVKLILERLKNCKKTDDLCHRIYLKGLANIKSPNASSSIAEYVLLNSSKRVCVYAMKALLLLGRDNWNEEVISLAERVYLANDSYDSSARVAALNILLETNRPTLYHKLLHLFKQNNAPSELKEYLLQRLSQISEKNEDAKNIIKSVILSEGLNHYNTYAQGGLSTAFDRYFMSKGHLSTAQEVKNGLLKEGYVHINFEEGGVTKTVFTLGLFSKGLSSFVSNDVGDEENEEASAGLELSVLGVEFRPFVFFEGQGELMGHVFSGAGSTLTPAFQALILLKDEHVQIPLGTGDLLSISIASLASVDLSGKIEISIWSRTAESLVQNSAGLIIEKDLSLNSPLSIRKKSILTAEPQLKLTSDIKFSGEIGLCLQLDQPQITVQYNTSLVTNVVDGSFRQNIIFKRRLNIPGKSYPLNSKNSEMCNILYNS